MKEKCDNICNTCPVNGQIYCALMFAKSNNEANKTLSERLNALEETLLTVATNNSNPFGNSQVIDPTASEV